MVLNTNQEIKVTEYSIKVEDKSNSNSSYPIGVVSLLAELQIRIGQTYDTFLECLNKVNMPILLNIGYKSGNISVIQVIRLGFGNTPELLLGVMTVYNGIIISYQYNDIRSTVGGKTQNLKISAMQQVRVPLATKDIEKTIVNLLSKITLLEINKNNWNITNNGKALIMSYNKDTQLSCKVPLNYYFSPDGHGNLFMNTIGYELNDIIASGI